MSKDVAYIHRRVLFNESNLLNEKQTSEIEVMKRKLNKSFLSIALNYGYLSRNVFFDTLKNSGFELFNFDFANLNYTHQFVSTKKDFDLLLDALIFPVSQNDELIFVVADPSDINNIRYVENFLKLEANAIRVAEDLDILKALHLTYGKETLKDATFELYQNDPKSSAIETFTKKQLTWFGALILMVLIVLYFNPLGTLVGFNLTLNLILLFTISFKVILTIVGSQVELEEKVTDKELSKIQSESLPFYSILLPVFKESEVINKLVWNINNLDYPKEKLDVKLLIESDDLVTINAIKNIKFPTNFQPIIVPYGQPKTKPKACNYGLHFAIGEYLTIYDAEDIPDSDQLKQVYALFQKLPSNYIAVQCALNYFNKNDNFLTRMFTLEYSYWFDYTLPGLDQLNIPIPLGGTSNHFKLKKLKKLGGWDSFNVTEDADLGLRSYAKNYKITVLNSTTYEEANSEYYNWIRQRSRWIKGYMQTYLVHMRNPIDLYRKVGFSGFWGFQFFIGGTFLTFLIYPLLLLLLIIYSITKSPWIEVLFPSWLLVISIVNLVIGNLMMIFINMIAIFKRRLYSLLIYAVASPVYWLMHSFASYKGLSQLIFNPFYWEKTNHGLAKKHRNK